MAAGNSGSFVTVGCKLPHGLILEVGKDETYQSITLNGANSTLVQGMSGGIPAGACGITENVPQALWDEWYKNNKDLSFVKSHAVFKQANAGDARAFANEVASEVTGLEPLNTEDDKDGKPKDKRLAPTKGKVKKLTDKEPV